MIDPGIGVNILVKSGSINNGGVGTVWLGTKKNVPRQPGHLSVCFLTKS